MGQIFVTIACRSSVPNDSGNFGGDFELPKVQGGVELGRCQERRGSPELQDVQERRMEDAQIGGLRVLAKLRMAGFWMHQVISKSGCDEQC